MAPTPKPPDLSEAIALQDAKRKLALDLYLAFEHRGDHFTAQLFRLMQKADSVNLRRLGRGFPLAEHVFCQWRDAPDAQTFYAFYDVGSLLRNEPAQAYAARFGKADDE